MAQINTRAQNGICSLEFGTDQKETNFNLVSLLSSSSILIQIVAQEASWLHENRHPARNSKKLKVLLFLCCLNVVHITTAATRDDVPCHNLRMPFFFGSFFYYQPRTLFLSFFFFRCVIIGFVLYRLNNHLTSRTQYVHTRS